MFLDFFPKSLPKSNNYIKDFDPWYKNINF